MTAHDSTRDLTAGCEDVVVVGRVHPFSAHSIDGRNNVQEEVSIEQAVLPGWYSGYDVEIRIKRVLHGREQRRTIPATFVYHGYPRDDVDMMIVLTSNGNGGYAIKSLNLSRGTKLRLECPAT